MLKINLLPIEQKKKLKLQFVYCSVIGSGLFLLLLVLIAIIVLALFLAFLDLRLYLIGKQIIDEQNRINQIETIKGVDKKIKSLNEEIVNLSKIQREQSAYYQVLLDVSQNLLTDVRTESISIEQESERITISGYSPTREALLAIKNKLESSPQKYKDVDFPLSNLTNPKNINFRFSFIYEF